MGLTRKGKNLNYYDDRGVLEKLEPFIIENLQKLVDFNVDRNLCFSIGGEKNYKYLLSLNKKFGWFKDIQPLPHPRFIMQYRRKQIQQYIEQYLEVLKK